MITQADLKELIADNLTEYRSVVQKMRDAVNLLEAYQLEDIEEGFTPRNTAEAYIGAIGASGAEIVAASLINVSAWDGRISPKNAEWASSVEQSFSADAMNYMRIFPTMHKCHLDQVANEIRKAVDA